MEPRRPPRADTGAPGPKPRSRPAATTAPATRSPRWLTDFGHQLAGLAVNPTTRAGLLGLALLFTGLSGNMMARTPAYYNVDETAHVGYLSSLAQGRFPEIESRSTVAQPDPALASRLAVAPDTLKTVWVANHPPGAYLPGVPLVWITNALGIESEVPTMLRLSGILAGLFAIGFTYLLGRELANGDERAGLLAAVLTACVPHLAYVSGTGLTDSAALAGGVAVTWMAVRMVRLGYTRHRTYWMAAFVTLAAFTRLTSAVLAVALVIVLTLLAKDGRVRFFFTTLLPAVGLTGWFYLRIQRLYGDVAASNYLLGRFDLAERSDIPTVLFDGGGWDRILRGLALTAPPYQFTLSYVWFRLIKIAVIGSLIAVVVTPIVRYLRQDRRPPFDIRRLDDRGTGRAGVFSALIVAISVALPFVLMAQHMAGGGGRHSRYLLPIVPAVAAVIARAVWLLAPKVAHAVGIAIVVIAGVTAAQVLRRYALPQFFTEPPVLWVKPLLPSAVSTLAATAAIVGFVVVVWAFSVDPQTRFFGGPTAAGTTAKSAKASKGPRPNGDRTTRPAGAPAAKATRPVSRR